MSKQSDDEHTEGGAPTDKAHARDGDGTLQNSVPAGLTPDELEEIAKTAPRDDGGTG